MLNGFVHASQGKRMIPKTGTLIQIREQSRFSGWLQIAVALLFAKVFLTILWEYRFYFPADFESAFLSGRRYTFDAAYRAAFYTHIMAGPPALLVSTFLLFSGVTGRARKAHRWLGRVQTVLVLFFLTPSGLLMARRAYAGTSAALGFSMLAIATAATLLMSIHHARHGRVDLHQRWAMRCWILLMSPLLLRVVAGALIYLDWDTTLSYQINAWLSWCVPCLVFEAYQYRSAVETFWTTFRSTKERMSFLP